MQTIEVTMESGEVREYPYGTPVNQIFGGGMSCRDKDPIIAALVNNALTSLSYKVEINTEVKPVHLYSTYGNRVYRRSLSFLLAMASQELFPERHLIIGHSLGDGFYYYYEGISAVSDADIKALETKMKELVQQSIPIQRQVISYEEAIRYLKENGLTATLKLLHYRNEPKIPIYFCNGFIDISYEPLVSNTDHLFIFCLQNYAPGFLLRFPQSRTPDRIDTFTDNPILFSIYKEYKAWGKILDVNCVGSLNELVEENRMQHFIQVAEALHEKKISLIADQIVEEREKVGVVLIAGPSSSGKTTFTRRLAIQLRVLGLNPISISLDDYYIPRDQTPLDEYGKPNFEDLHALNIELLNQNLLDLFAGKEVEIPIFDFKLQRPRDTGNRIRMSSRSILLMEGIHGLNPGLTPNIPDEKKYRIYISALTQLNLDDHNRISTTDNRLIRRIVRDHQFRGTSALGTLEMWDSVRRGENKNIFPYQNEANSAFNSALDYELSVLKPYVEPLLKTVKPHHDVYNEALRLLSFVENFSPIPSHQVPSTSILREFIGGSIFYS